MPPSLPRSLSLIPSCMAGSRLVPVLPSRWRSLGPVLPAVSSDWSRWSGGVGVQPQSWQVCPCVALNQRHMLDHRHFAWKLEDSTPSRGLPSGRSPWGSGLGWISGPHTSSGRYTAVCGHPAPPQPEPGPGGLRKERGGGRCGWSRACLWSSHILAGVWDRPHLLGQKLSSLPTANPQSLSEVLSSTEFFCS